MWEKVAKQIRKQQNFVLTTHINPEGDAIGAEIAMAVFLKNAGKSVTIVNSSPTPQNSRFMDPDNEIRIYPADYSAEILDQADAVIIVDVNNWGHVGPFGDVLRDDDTPRICIDHHQGIEPGFADVTVSDTSAAAAGLMVYDLVRYMGAEVTPRIAEVVYAALITDTGTFRFSNTDEKAFRVAGELLRKGVDPFAVHREVFAKTRGAVKLLGAVVSTMDTTEDGRIAWIHATQAMFNAAGADYEDSDGLLDVVRAIKKVEFCLFFKETVDGRIKISLRSNGNVDVYEIAKALGGGGHKMAAGASVDGAMADAIRKVIEASKRYLPDA